MSFKNTYSVVYSRQIICDLHFSREGFRIVIMSAMKDGVQNTCQHAVKLSGAPLETSGLLSVDPSSLSLFIPSDYLKVWAMRVNTTLSRQGSSLASDRTTKFTNLSTPLNMFKYSLCRTMKNKVSTNYVEIKCQLDATEVFIADLIACSTCFGHHYAHHQELKSITQWLLPVVFRAVKM